MLFDIVVRYNYILFLLHISFIAQIQNIYRKASYSK